MSALDIHEHDLVFKALADPTRRQILGLLRAGTRNVNEIAQNFQTSRPAISKHLRLLRSAGLIETRKQGTASLCALNSKPLRVVDEWLRDYEIYWDDTLNNLKHYVEEQP
jgi:DNA-binding transcriptional ArsR family regulator